MIMRHRLATASLLLLLTACGGNHDAITGPDIPATPAAPISAATLASIDSYVQAQMSAQHIPGLSLLVTMDGKPVLHKGYGEANLASHAAVTPDTVFRIGSVTKQFTATAIMMLVQEGKLTLGQPVSSLFPTAPASWKGMTIRHLLTHTSGLQRDFPPELMAQIPGGTLPGMDALIALGGQVPLASAPGAAHSYSNMGYHLLGFVIEKITGQNYATFLQQRVFAPLDMGSADVILTTKPVPTMAAGYTFDGASIKPATTHFLIPGLEEAEGGLQMNAVDLAKWDAALLTERFLTKASKEQMWTPAKLNDGSTVPYGFGWVLADANGHPFTSHNGRVEGFTTEFDRHTGEGMSVIVLDNQDEAVPGRIAAHVSALIKPQLDWVIATDPRPATGSLLRGLIDEAMRGNLVIDGRFAPETRAALTPEVVEAYTGYFKPWSPITQFGYIDTQTINGAKVARYLVRSKLEDAVIGIVLDAEGRVTQLGLLSE